MNAISYDQLKFAFGKTEPTERLSLSIPEYNKAAVLVPLVLIENTLELLFTKRTDTVETHKGQISFPGGMVDVRDADIVHTALREAEEEIGLFNSSVEIVGLLNDMATPSGFVITPVVGLITALPVLTLSQQEVSEVFRVGLEFFADSANGRTELREFHGKRHEVWFYEYGGHVIWGATAMMIRSLLKKLQVI